MSKKAIEEGIILLAFGVLGFVHEFIISDEAELFPIILFGIISSKGITKFLGKD